MKNLLFISSFPFYFYSVNYNRLCLVIYRIKNTIISDSDTIALLSCKFFGIMRSWIGRKGKNYFVNGGSKLYWNNFSFFLGLSFYNKFIAQSFSQDLRNLLYGMKDVASLSALRRSFASSRSSINSRIFSYSLRLRITAFLLPFLLTIYSGLMMFITFCIFSSNVRMIENSMTYVNSRGNL